MGLMSVMSPGMVPASQASTIPVGTAPPPSLSATMLPQGMMGLPQQQGIVGAVVQPGMTQTPIGMVSSVPHTGRVGL